MKAWSMNGVRYVRSTTTSASRKPASTSPLRIFQREITFPVGSSRGASGHTGGRWRQVSMIAAGMIRERPITRPIGCAPRLSAVAIPTASSRKRSPATAL
jgi:hypothetical protein